MGDPSLPPSLPDGPATPVIKEFMPWHKPRKQFIRKKQWAKAARDLLSSMNNDQVNYMTLPGKDLLDIEVMAETCRENGKKLNFLGFNQSSDDSELLAQDIQLFDTNGKGLPFTDRSKVLSRKVEEINGNKTIAKQTFLDMGPFHIINLDACNSLANREWGETETRLIDALKEILDLQMTHCGHDWLLFLTTKFSPSNIHDSVFEKLMEAIKCNANQCATFRQEAERCLGLSSGDISLPTFTTKPNGASDGFVRKCTLGLGKWLYHQLCQTQWNMEIVDAYSYATGAQNNMLSLVMKFHRVHQKPEDRTGIVPVASQNRSAQYTDSRLAQNLGHMRNLDDKLSSNDDCMENLIEEAANQLKQRGYNTGNDNHDLYREWLKSQ